MKLYAIQHKVTGEWFTSTRGHVAFTTASAAANAFHAAMRGWVSGKGYVRRYLKDDPEWVRKEVRLVPVETP